MPGSLTNDGSMVRAVTIDHGAFNRQHESRSTLHMYLRTLLGKGRAQPWRTETTQTTQTVVC